MLNVWPQTLLDVGFFPKLIWNTDLISIEVVSLPLLYRRWQYWISSGNSFRAASPVFYFHTTYLYAYELITITHPGFKMSCLQNLGNERWPLSCYWHMWWCYTILQETEQQAPWLGEQYVWLMSSRQELIEKRSYSLRNFSTNQQVSSDNTP